MNGPLPIQFDPASLVLLNALLALMMFGVSLTLKPADFRIVVTQPRPVFAGLFAQFLLLPAATCLATWFFNIDPQLSLGMMLVAACPGGAFSNIMTWLARGNVAVSVSMTAVSSLVATVMTPFNFAFYGWLNPNTRDLLVSISVDAGSIVLLVLVVLGLPLVIGMSVGQRFPGLAARVEPPLRIFALLVFLAFVAIAFSSNFGLFIERFHTFFWLVFAHNAMALLLGALMARLMRLNTPDRRAVTIEVGIQNSGLGLIILFTFMPNAGGMMLITAFWGVWHLVSGLTLASIWARIPIRDAGQPSASTAAAPVQQQP